MLTCERPTPEPHSAETTPVYCRRCDNPRPLAVVAPATLILRHRHHEQTITGLTPQQHVWARCPRCHCQQEIVVPPLVDVIATVCDTLPS